MNSVEERTFVDTKGQRTAGIGQVIARCLAIGLGYAVITLATGALLGLDAGDGIVTASLLLTLGGTLLALVMSLQDYLRRVP